MFSVERKVKQANLVITLSSLPSHHRSCFLSNRVESSLENMDLSGFQEGMSEQHHVFWMTAQVENSEIRIDINLQQFLIRESEDSLESVPQPISNGWIGKGGGKRPLLEYWRPLSPQVGGHVHAEQRSPLSTCPSLSPKKLHIVS